jgi:membrane dipeptidase
MTSILDGHNDVLTRADHAGFPTGRPTGHLDLPRMRSGGLRAAVFAVCPACGGAPTSPVSRDDGVLEFPYAPPLEPAIASSEAVRATGRLHALARAGHLRIALHTGDLDAVHQDPSLPPAAILGFEGAEAIDPELEALELFYAAGLRVLGPVWSRANAFAHGVPFVFPSSPDTGPGLTEAGVRLARRCAELGILLDLSHLNERGFWDIHRLDLGPLVVSHAGVHAISPCTRNLTDEQLDAIGQTDGLVGIVYSCAFLRGDFREDLDTPLQAIAEHVRYVAERIGIEHVALGSDFDGTTIPAALGDAAGLPELLRTLREHGGLTTDELQAVAWGNWRRVLGAWWAE